MSEQYKAAGVDIAEGGRAVALMRDAVRATFTPNVLADVGSFGGLFALRDLPREPVLVASTDGVGTKVKLAAQRGQWRGIGHDIVNHCVNDIVVQGARPLFFLDYIASSKLIAEQVAEVVIGVAEACQAAGCALLGGETAEMPGVYAEGAFDLAGTVVGVVGQGSLLPRPDQMEAGDRLFGLPSSGPHTNGYSLIRKLLDEHHGTDEWADACLEPHRSYLKEIDMLDGADVPIKGLAHITGGGFTDNIPRILPDSLDAALEPWPLSPLFATLCRWSGMAWAEAAHVFNLGIGMVIVVDRAAGDALQAALPEARPIGTLVDHDDSPPRVRWSQP
ncbi:MAG: phosphoribosylformylglycinamidine cyclo-ligase [Anaerolineales bacterium]|nr:phosphoribosylformylglycinamidine cyclo-ligase [Anaerolineales bacterium]MCB9128553.1 phosphoribosylformylglycinamidine cyclo-ligase [Ardenticatenales bacterium]